MKRLLLASAAALLLTGTAMAQEIETNIDVALDDDTWVHAYQNNNINNNAQIVGGIANAAIGSTINVDDVDLEANVEYELDIDVELYNNFFVHAEQLNNIQTNASIGGDIDNTAVGSNIDIVYDDVDENVVDANTDIQVDIYDNAYIYAYQDNNIDAEIDGDINNAAIASNINVEGISSRTGDHDISVSMDDNAFVHAEQLNNMTSANVIVQGALNNTAVGSAISVDFD